MIIDSHLHLPQLREGKTLADSKQELLHELEKSKVDYAIVIPDNTPVSEIGSLDEVLGLVEHDRNLFVMGTINMQKDKEPHIRKLDFLFQTGRIVAMKIFPGHEPTYPTDKRLVPVYELCVKYDLPIVIHTGLGSKIPEPARYNDPRHIVKVAKRFPTLKIVIAHYFWPRVEYCYELTKPYENIYFDTSALADDEVIAETGLDKIKKVLTLTVEQRPRNVVFGTDYAMCNIKKHVDLIESLAIRREFKEMIFSKNSIQLFKLRLGARAGPQQNLPELIHR
jgi:predicted TIM-barrel fold metal-dependent hydrolase